MTILDEIESQGDQLAKFRIIIPSIILYVSIYLWLDSKLHPEEWILKGTAFEEIYVIGCIAVSMFGEFVRVFAVGYSAGEVSEGSFNSEGLYSVVRYPLYVGNFFIWVGIAMLTGNFWFVMAFMFLYFLYYERLISSEEKKLTLKFGDQYVEWSKKTSAIFPCLRNFIKPTVSFSWKKMLKNEIKYIAGLATVFFLFISLDQVISIRVDYFSFVIVICIIAFFAYLFVLRYLRQRTLS